MPRSPRSTRPRSGRPGRSRATGHPASAPQESSSRLLFTARLVPDSADTAVPDVPDVPAAAAATPTDDLGEHHEVTAGKPTVPVSSPLPTVPPPAPPAPAPVAGAPVTVPSAAPAGPAAQVHAEHLESVSPKLELTPSQAVRLANDGRDVLTRVRPRAG